MPVNFEPIWSEPARYGSESELALNNPCVVFKVVPVPCERRQTWTIFGRKPSRDSLSSFTMSGFRVAREVWDTRWRNDVDA